MRLIPGLSLIALLRAIAAQVLSDPAMSSSRQRAGFAAIAGSADLDQWFTHSKLRPVVLFLHDPGCPVSSTAYREVAKLDAEIGLIDVRTGRSLSHAVEGRTGLRHESPQAIVLRDGQAVWSASHYAITAEAVATASHED